MNVEELDWLEDRNGCTRYATEPEESVWVCSECSEPHDPDEDEPCECREEN